MSLKLLLVLLLMLIGVEAQGASNKEGKETRHKPSSDIRANQSFYTALGVSFFGNELRLGVYLPNDFTIEAANKSYGGFIVGGYPQQLTLVRVRKFVTNSFYVAAELGTGKIESGMDNDYEDGAHVKQYAFSIGNEWIIADHLLIGGEWLSLGQTHYTGLQDPENDSGQKYEANARLAMFWIGTTF